MFCVDGGFENILREQYYLSKYGHINLSDSEYLTDFERKIYLGFVVKDLKAEVDAKKKK